MVENRGIDSKQHPSMSTPINSETITEKIQTRSVTNAAKKSTSSTSTAAATSAEQTKTQPTTSADILRSKPTNSKLDPSALTEDDDTWSTQEPKFSKCYQDLKIFQQEEEQHDKKFWEHPKL